MLNVCRLSINCGYPVVDLVDNFSFWPLHRRTPSAGPVAHGMMAEALPATGRSLSSDQTSSYSFSSAPNYGPQIFQYIQWTDGLSAESLTNPVMPANQKKDVASPLSRTVRHALMHS